MRRSLWLALAGAAVVLVLSGCGRAAVGDEEDEGPRILTLSPTWQQGVEGAVFQERVGTLTRGLERLREETGTSWVGRQDDVTGYLAEVSGGGFALGEDASPEDHAVGLLRRFGIELFGASPAQLRVRSVEGPDPSGGVTVRLAQRLGNVPVIDGALVAAVTAAEDTPRVTMVQGRVFPALEVSTAPVITPAEAARAARDASGGQTLSDPRLVILPVGERGALAWEVEVEGGQVGGAGTSLFYVDAQRGGILAIRPQSPEAAPALAGLGGGALAGLGPTQGADLPQGEAVEVTGQDPNGEDLTATGTRTADGSVALVDPTTPSFDPATGEGAVVTRDAAGMTEGQEDQLPGAPIVASPDQRIADPEALAAHRFSREVVDYYADTYGRDSWDGEGGTLNSAVNFGEPDFCNAFFNPGLRMMVYGNPCVRDGVQQETSTVEIDTAGHEVTHGVTGTSSDLIYVGQSGALNESFSDFFGNVIGDRYHGSDSDAVFEDGCVGITEPTGFCRPNPDGTRSLRYMLPGVGFSDYQYLLQVPLTHEFFGIKQDNGGVHLNSAIFNDTLWSIRRQLAASEGVPMVESRLAAAFDSVVYGALTRRLTQSSGFLDARAAIEAEAVAQQAPAKVLQVARQQFDLHDICTGCAPLPGSSAVPVATTPAAQVTPVVSGNRVGWVDVSAGGGSGGFAAQGAPGQEGIQASAQPDVLSVALTGEALVTTDWNGELAMYRNGSREVLDPQITVDGAVVGVAGSPEGVAWTDWQDTTIAFATPGGEIQRAPDPLPEESLPVSIATGGGSVAVGYSTGEVLLWRPGSDPAVVGTLDGPVLGVGVHGNRVLAVGGPEFRSSAVLFDGGASTVLSENAAPFGAAVSADHVVWAEIVGELGGGVAQLYRAFPDTDLFLYSFASGNRYTVLEQRGQQGFPSLSGNRLVWQEAGAGGDDVYLIEVPAGL